MVMVTQTGVEQYVYHVLLRNGGDCVDARADEATAAQAAGGRRSRSSSLGSGGSSTRCSRRGQLETTQSYFTLYGKGCRGYLTDTSEQALLFKRSTLTHLIHGHYLGARRGLTNKFARTALASTARYSYRGYTHSAT